MSKTLRDEWSVSSPFKPQQPGFLCSLECEIEALKEACCHDTDFFQFKTDASLRGCSGEWVSSYPLPRKEAVDSFKKLHNGLKFNGKDNPFSERTSLHVHVNCLDITPEQVRNIILLYALFEPFFFMMVAPNRRHNIHCVPLTETYFPKYYKNNLQVLHKNWHKYTALNARRLSDLGTLEFRHLQGTSDPVLLDEWLHVIENLWFLGQRIQINEEVLKNMDTLYEWFDLLFFPSDRVRAVRSSMVNIFQNNLIDVKFAV